MAHRVCPWWMGYLLAGPIRRLLENPDKMLSELVEPGMTVLDIGCAMGFFTLPVARKVGSEGRVIAVDLQEKMLNSLRRRARRADLLERIELRTCGEKDLGVDDLVNQVDLALAFHVVHEVPDAPGFFTQLYSAIKPGGRLLLAEPEGHITESEYADTEATAQNAGFASLKHLEFRRSRATLFEKR